MMGKAQARPCSSCLYWQIYPTWEGFGVCDNPVSHNYNRGVPGATAACDDFTMRLEVRNSGMGGARSKVYAGLPESRDVRSSPFCSECHYWLPVDYLEYLGECTNSKAADLKKPVWADKSAGTCFTERSLEGLQLLWCQTCHLTISSLDTPNHPDCRLYVGAAQPSVDDMMELTVAGD